MNLRINVYVLRDTLLEMDKLYISEVQWSRPFWRTQVSFRKTAYLNMAAIDFLAISLY